MKDREGLPFGGMPNDILLLKLEETDPALVGGVRGYNNHYDVAGEHDKYVRSEIVDWGSDTPFLESDKTRRDPGLSRSILNLHYNGTRGSNPELPRHPEMFYGFTGNDPRGSTNDPRFDQMRGQMMARAGDLTVRMGNNDTNHIAERPWTNQSISYSMKELQRRVKGNLRVFDTEKDGRSVGNSIVADHYTAGKVRSAVFGAGGETFQDRARFTGNNRNSQSDHGTASGHFVQAARGAVKKSEHTPWFIAEGEADLGVQDYSQGRRTGVPDRNKPNKEVTRTDQDWSTSDQTRMSNKGILAASMALAAKTRKTARASKQQHDNGESIETMQPGHLGAPVRAVAAVYRVAEDTDRAESMDAMNRGGPVPQEDPTGALRKTAAHTSNNSHLTNLEAIVTGLRTGDRRGISRNIVADGTRARADIEGVAIGSGLTPSAGYTAPHGITDIVSVAANNSLIVHNYTGSAPKRYKKAANAQKADDATQWKTQNENSKLGRNTQPVWKSTTKTNTIGDREFNHNMETSNSAKGALGLNAIRAIHDSAMGENVRD